MCETAPDLNVVQDVAWKFFVEREPLPKVACPKKIDDFTVHCQCQLAGTYCADEAYPIWVGEKTR